MIYVPRMNQADKGLSLALYIIICFLALVVVSFIVILYVLEWIAIEIGAIIQELRAEFKEARRKQKIAEAEHKSDLFQKRRLGRGFKNHDQSV